MGLKGRLLTAFTTIILLPILTVIGIFNYFSFTMDEVTQEENEAIDTFHTSINQIVIDHFDQLDNQEVFYQTIKPTMDKYNVQIIVRTSDNNEVLFRSSNFDTQDSNSYLFTIRQSQIQTANGSIANIEMKSVSPELEGTQSFKDVITNIVIGFGSGLLVLIILVVGWTFYISRTVLNPIKQIYTATEEVQEGNMDYPIRYYKKDEIGRFIHGFNLMRDHLKQSFAKQRQYEKNRKELIANISHDLRTPLQSIKGYVEGINDGIVKNEEMKKRYLQVILSKTEQLDRLIDNLFEFSKIDLDQFVVDKRLVNSEAFFTELLSDAETDLAQKEVKLIVEKPIPSLILAIDSMRIEQVITNLLDNAVSYGGTLVQVSIQEDKQKESLHVHIRDDGNGIATEDLPNIFTRFYRGEKSRSRELGGTGLGLAIVKTIIEAHSGTISVESEEGVGSEFTFSLPVIDKTE
ncbi:hypothetical protein GCM10011351_15740 [Paraliobacillus quinghaiensis]|uniref:histidine kinase n=1 Tax=Paraliobacillus quinghaiensis TaxID=470815 RepID=A0A917TPM2_9BACI|nr:ATP-binding protein [Paraliobacillus quinghaiensis]GGM30438.1 hypothetical protein GCM10011351_15740 [Paraliobacillus quinghaiensis]